jgi:hypothetical protein
MRTLSFVFTFVVATSVALAGPAPQPPELPDEASDVAVGVLGQLSQGIIPPEPATPAGEEDPAPEPPELSDWPTLPDEASDVAKSVLEQLAAGTIPPVPPVPGDDAAALIGPPDLPDLPDLPDVPELPVLPDEASDVAKGIHQQLADGICPPQPEVPEVETDTGEAAPTAAFVPEPATLGVLALGGLVMLRRKRR